MSNGDSRIVLPDAPLTLVGDLVKAWREPVVIDTYEALEPHPFPAYLGSRVYQGSSGVVYPMPFHESIATKKTPRKWDAVHLENEWVRLMIMPELGGRIHIGYDKTGDYDFFYRNNVIKPALVGLAGPWISGGVEFNWPQHHRPATYLPVDIAMERENDGSITVWCSQHDPLQRLKGMHGIRLRTDSSLIEARVRLTNRTDVQQSFLWWANVAAPVNDDYQAFFPDDVHYVADHAKRAVVSFPAADRPYYGVDYPAIAAQEEGADRIDWWKNIPVPTSYMVLDSAQDFFGGYDHGRAAGFVHWADHAIAPGKKLWTWGNSDFGRAWEQNLTDGDGPYIELMAGGFSDNQPDFAFLEPGETKSFSEYWYPIREIGPASAASRAVAMNLRWDMAGHLLHIALHASARFPRGQVRVVDRRSGEIVAEVPIELEPDVAHSVEVDVGVRIPLTTLRVMVLNAGRVLLKHDPIDPGRVLDEPTPAEAPMEAEQIGSTDELYLIGRYLKQYRHPTRSALPYWRRALQLDPGDVRSNTALGADAYRSARYSEAERFLRTAVGRLTARTRTPVDSTPDYLLGLTLERLGDLTAAVEAFRRAMWATSLRVIAGFAVARILVRQGDAAGAAELLSGLAEHAPENGRVLCLRVLAESEASGAASTKTVAARIKLEAFMSRDPLDQWGCAILGRPESVDLPTRLDTALEYRRAGLPEAALTHLNTTMRSEPDASTALGQTEVLPLMHYHRAALLEDLGRPGEAATARRVAQSTNARRCAPSRLEDIEVLERAVEVEAGDALASALLGNWYFSVGRTDDAESAWTRALESGSGGELDALVLRNLGLHAYNVLHKPEQADYYYRRARQAAPADAKLVIECEQLSARRGVAVSQRLDRLLANRSLVEQRDDAVVALARLLVTCDRPDEARELLAARTFQPWEGGEGAALGVWEDAAIMLARRAIAVGDPDHALHLVDSAITPPANLAEARHPLASAAHLRLTRGDAFAAASRFDEARDEWRIAARSASDFHNMSTAELSERSINAMLALRRLGDYGEADVLLARLRSFLAEQMALPTHGPEFFATSLSSTLLFVDDPEVMKRRRLEGFSALVDRAEASVSIH